MLLAAVAADDARVVVIFYVQGVPGLSLQLFLPFGEGALHLHEVEGHLDHVDHEAVCLHVGEGDHLVEDLVLALGDVFQCAVRRRHRAFADREAVIEIQHVALEFHQILMRLRAVGIVVDAVGHGQGGIGAWQPLILGDKGDDVLAEAVHPHVQPEAQDVLDLLAHLGIGHVQIRLLFGKDMEIILVELCVVFPCAALEHARPVVRRQAAAAARPLALAPVVIVVVRVVLALPAFEEPSVLVRGVVDDQVHKHPHPARVRAVEHLAEDVEIAVVGVDVHIVGNIIAVVGVRRREERRKPDCVNVQGFDVVQLLQHAPQIADAVAVSVAKAARPDLIDGHLLVPIAFCHVRFPSFFLMRSL